MDTLNYRVKTKLPSFAEMKRDGLKQKGNRFYKNIERDKCTLKLHTSRLYGQEFLNVEASAPKLLLGSNVAMVTANDLEYLNDTVTAIVAEETRIPFEANDATLTRLDFAYNWNTPSETYAHAYRDAMKDITLSGRFEHWTGNKEHAVETVYWSNKSQEILVYPKFAETKNLVGKGKASVRDLEKARGMLRGEHRLLKADVVQRVIEQFGYRNRAADLVPHLSEMTVEIMQADMKQLGLDSPIEIAGEVERFRKLQEACGTNTRKLEALAGFLAMCDIHGENNLVGMGLINAKTFGTRKTELKRMGISLSKPRRGYVLPPLPVPSYQDSGKQFSKTRLSSTGRMLPPYITDSPVYVEGVF